MERQGFEHSQPGCQAGHEAARPTASRQDTRGDAKYKTAGSCGNWSKLAWACSHLKDAVSTLIQSGILFFLRHTGNPDVM